MVVQLTKVLLTAVVVVFLYLAGPVQATQSNGATGKNDKLLSQLDPDTARSVLSKSDQRLYREIFTLQEKGRWRQADKRIRKLENRLLMGHVLYQRYMHPRAYRSRYKELRGWLAQYARQPGAEKIYKLAMKRKPRRARAPQSPLNPKLLPRPTQTTKRVKVKRKVRPRMPGMNRKARYLHHLVKKYSRKRQPTKAAKILARRDSRKYIPAARYDEGRVRIARACACVAIRA